MKILATTVALVILSLLVSPARAQTVVGTLTCDDSNISATVYETEVYVFRVPFLNLLAGLTYVISDSDSYPAIFSAGEAGTVFPSCSITNGAASVVMTNAVFEGFSLAGFGNGVAGAADPLLFSIGVLSYDSVSAGGVTLPVINSAAVKAQIATMKAARRKAFTDSFAKHLASQ